MSSMHNDSGSNQAGTSNVECDEINLFDYILILSRHKLLIALGAFLPALLVGIYLYLQPRDYSVSYKYNISIPQVKAFEILESNFYSTENLQKLFKKLRESGLDGCGQKIAETEMMESAKGFISFQISPSFIKPSEVKDFEELQKLQEVEGALLVMGVKAKSGGNIHEIATVCRNNFEQVMPMYSEKEMLNSKIVSLKADMAGIEDTRYTLNLELERKMSTLEKLKSSASEGLDKLPSEIILQFSNVGENSAFLPLAYQLQAAKTQIIDLEDRIRANEEMYAYCADLLKLNETLLSHVEQLMPSYYTIQQYHSFLSEQIDGYEATELQDYLKAHLKEIENTMTKSPPLAEKPGIYTFPRGTVKKSAMVFVIALMVSIIAAILSEGLKKSQA
ncbi:MAG: hypothetical protein H8E17_09805 [Deltaproteobacteria bacterium]|nr:hypothetical protein [Deltaproteobacteria bacterium]